MEGSLDLVITKRGNLPPPPPPYQGGENLKLPPYQGGELKAFPPYQGGGCLSTEIGLVLLLDKEGLGAVDQARLDFIKIEVSNQNHPKTPAPKSTLKSLQYPLLKFLGLNLLNKDFSTLSF